MTRLAIIADDLSSATDCGAQVVRSSLSVVVPLGSYSLPSQRRTAQVISVDTDSRSLPAEQAFARVRAAAGQLVDEGWSHFYKSVDSTLRGNLGAEIEAIMGIVRPDCAVIAPAFPKYGRTTVEGVQYLHGRPLHETEFGTDPTAPVWDANIARRLAEGSHRKAGRLELAQVSAGPSEVESALRGLLGDGIELVIVDIAEQDDLRRICLGLAESDLRILWVGSTGLAEFVPLAFGAASTPEAPTGNPLPDPRPSLALVGSASETTRAQLDYAWTNHQLNIITLDPACIVRGDGTAIKELDRAGSDLRAAIEAGQDSALVVNASRDEIAATQQLGATLNLSATEVAQRIVDALAQTGSDLARQGRISGIVATGGDTANALCTALGARALEILGEVEAGIPVMRVLGEESLPLVTKAGGFGSPAAIGDALLKVKQYA
jgi:D-threonate/D-erythronate kinase